MKGLVWEGESSDEVFGFSCFLDKYIQKNWLVQSRGENIWGTAEAADLQLDIDIKAS